MPNIVLSRIDERLIHGQVGVQWVGFAGANLVLVANDEVAEDPVQQNLMEMVLAEGIAVRFWPLQKVIDNIHRAADRQKILLVWRYSFPSAAAAWRFCSRIFVKRARRSSVLRTSPRA